MEDAEALYNACQTAKPSWDQLGDVTKSVWRGYAAQGIKPEQYAAAWPFPMKVPEVVAEPVMFDSSKYEAIDVILPGDDEPTQIPGLLKPPARPLTLKEKLALKGFK